MDDLLPGRSCPLDYRYSPSQIAQSPLLARGAVYAAGGLYGNLASLSALQALLAVDPCADAELVFNGDFHWFDAQADWFAQVEAGTAAHTRLRGNVETEFSRATDLGAGCGCAYPEGVDEAVVERSNRIEHALAQVARGFVSDAAQPWAALPMYLRREVAGVRLAVVHGDAWSLSGWAFAAGLEPEILRQACEQADVNLFLSSHTCEAFELLDPQYAYGVLNNGAAGMPSAVDAEGRHRGLVCRIAEQPHPARPVARWRFGDAWLEWLPLDCATPAFTERFLQRWPTGSDAYESYWARISQGCLTW